jgi:hypothetical protein
LEKLSLAQVLSLFGKSLKKSKKDKNEQTEIDPSVKLDPPMKKGQLSKDHAPFKSLVKLRFFNLVSKIQRLVMFEDENSPVWQYQPTKDIIAVIPPCRVIWIRKTLTVKVEVELLKNMSDIPWKSMRKQRESNADR